MPRRPTWRRFRGFPTSGPLRVRSTKISIIGSSDGRCTGNSALSASTANDRLPRAATQGLGLTTGTRSAMIPGSPSTGGISICPATRLETCDSAKRDHPFRWDDADSHMPWPVDLRYEAVVGFTSRGEIYVRSDVPLPDAIRRALELAITGRTNGAPVRRSIVNLNDPALVKARSAAVRGERRRLQKDFENRTATKDEREARASQLLGRLHLPEFVSIRVASLRKTLGRGR